MTHDWPIDRDVACTKCGFNVRTLAVTSRCTECGFPVLRSFVGHEADVKRGAPVDADKVTRTALLVLSRLLKRNRDALGFILLAYRHAARTKLPEVPRLIPRRVDVPAAELCRALAECVLDYYGNRDALATLRFWRVESGEDVGEIVAGLIETGLLSPGPNDSPADFVGVGSIADMLPPPLQ